MIGVMFLFTALFLVGVMVGALCFVSKTSEQETSSSAPLESGLVTTGRVFSVLSLQLFIILILFLVFDLEVVLVVALVLSGSAGKVSSGVLVSLIVGSLWAEWAWGKLFWAV